MTRTIIALLAALLAAAGFTLHMPAVVAPDNGAATETLTTTVTVTTTATGTPTPTGTATNTSTVTPTPTVTATSTDTGTPTITPTSTDTGTPTTTPTTTDTPTVTPTATPTETQQPPCPCEADTLNCSDFATQPQAQACMDYCIGQGAGDIHNLDGNANGIACESLPPNFKVLELAR